MIADWNAVLNGDGVRLAGSVGHTGNYIAEADRPVTENDFVGLFNRLGVRVAAFSEADFLNWVGGARSALAILPSTDATRRPTAGVVMDLNVAGGVPPKPPSSEKVRVSAFAVERVRGVWKLDILRPDGRALDSKKREGGWGGIATMMQRHSGGQWTARSMNTISRLAELFEPIDTPPFRPHL